MTGAATQPRPLDLRLVPSALVVWSVTLLGLLCGWRHAAGAAVFATATALVVCWFARARRWSSGVLAVLVLATVAGVGTATRVHQVEDHPLRAAAERGEHVTVRATLRERAQPLRGASYGSSPARDRSRVRAELNVVDTATGRVQAGGAVLLLVPSDSWRPLIAGQTVTVRAKALPPRRSDLLVAVLSSYRAPEKLTTAPEWQRVAERLRDGLRRTAGEVLGQQAAGLLPGLVVGDTSGLAPEIEQVFDAAGLTHLMAVSGANLAIVCGAVLLLMRMLSLGPLLSAGGAGFALIGFVVLAGPEPSVLRAAVMGAVTLLALVLGRQHSALPALAVSVLGLLLIVPSLAVSIGFALSVVATAALVTMAPSWSAGLNQRGIPRGLAEAIAVSTAAQVVTTPLVAAVSGQISLVAILANLAAGPLVAPATVLGVLATVLEPILPALARAAVWLAGPELEWILGVARFAAALPGAVLEWPAGVGGGLLLAVLSLVALLVFGGTRLRWTLVALVLIAVFLVSPNPVSTPGWPASGWTMVACDVGQGDGLVLATGNPHEAVVVDTGPDPELVPRCLRRLGVRRISLVVLTHLHADHVSGLASVLAEFPVGAVALGGLREPDWAMADIRRASRTESVPITQLAAGQRVRWPGLVLDVLGPTGHLARTQDAEDANDASVVLRATTPAGRVLLTGDIELAGQAALQAAGVDLRADVLKIPHHGSRDTAPSFLRAVRPRLALVSVGAGNRYGHPSPLVLGELQRAGVAVLRTDQEGDIAVLPGERGPSTVTRGNPIP